jgi:hypothetical protein
MSKSMKSKKTLGVKPGVEQKSCKCREFNSRNLMGANPMKEQFEPTDSMAIPQHKRMAGES